MGNRFLPQFLAAVLPSSDHTPDSELLRRFARDRDTAAFELLLRRHGRAVWTACRRILSVEADAEDAFQATFLVLARKAGSVRGGSVAGWLHRVAVTAALKARRRAVRHTSATPEQLAAIPSQDIARSDSAVTLQEELTRLPDHYRLPLVLCELEGLSHAEAATTLGCPIGTVSGRLSRARDMLRARLSRRGISGPLALTPLAGLPPRLVVQTTAAATGASPVIPAVSSLTQGVLSMMSFAKAKMTAVLVGIAGLVGFASLGGYAAWVPIDDGKGHVAPAAFDGGEAEETAVPIVNAGGETPGKRDAEAKESAAEREVKKLQGKWKVVRLEEGGKKSDVKGMNWAFTGNLIEGQDPNGQSEKIGSFTLNPEKSPKQIDIVSVEGTNKGKTMLGIYKLEGDRLTICVRDHMAEDTGRPSEFSSERGTNQGVIVLERLNEADKKQSSAKEETKKLQGKWKAVSFAADGSKGNVEDKEGMGWTFTGNLIEQDQGPLRRIGTFTLDPEKSPKQFDLVDVEGPQKGKTRNGIYKLDEKRLTICLPVKPEMVRPAEFSAEKGTDQVVIVLERLNVAEKKDSSIEEVVKKLQGNWKVVSMHSEGADVGVNGMNWTFTGNLIEGQLGNGVPQKVGTFTVHPEKTPGHIDVISVHGPQKGKKMPGIYMFEGERLTLCLRNQEAKGRPTEFSAEKGTEQSLIVLERGKAPQ